MKLQTGQFTLKSLIATLFISFFLFSLSALDYYAEGEALFNQNRYAEAIPLLFQASQIAGTNPNVYLFLGLSYQQTGKYADAISTFMRGTSQPQTDRKALFFNAGNIYFLQELYSEAEKMYTRAIELDSAYAAAFLNRANTRVRLQMFEQAVEDYSTYLMLDPATWQRDPITQMIALLRGEVQTQKENALRTQAELATLEAEKKAAAERYKQLLDAVSSSLQSVDGASTLSAGSENIMEYNEEGQLE